jgi:hypothetical protein
LTLRYLPLLQVQRDLYNVPRGMERFRAYIAAMVDAETGDLALPLVAMNPMGRDHVPAIIEAYMAFDAESTAERATHDAAGRLSEIAGDFRAGLVVSDDLKGGWTNRFASEFSHRFEGRAMFRRGWAVGVLWTSDPPSAAAPREAVLTAIYRAAYTSRHGLPRTLGEMLAQEGWVTARAGCRAPRLEHDDLAYTRDVIRPLLHASDRATQMACVFGDACARAFGYEPRGLSDRAGLALALFDGAAALEAGVGSD